MQFSYELSVSSIEPPSSPISSSEDRLGCTFCYMYRKKLLLSCISNYTTNLKISASSSNHPSSSLPSQASSTSTSSACVPWTVWCPPLCCKNWQSRRHSILPGTPQHCSISNYGHQSSSHSSRSASRCEWHKCFLRWQHKALTLGCVCRGGKIGWQFSPL